MIDPHYERFEHSVIQACTTLHEDNTGACDCSTGTRAELLSWLSWRYDNWYPSMSSVDDAIHKLVATVLTETRRVDMKRAAWRAYASR